MRSFLTQWIGVTLNWRYSSSSPYKCHHNKEIDEMGKPHKPVIKRARRKRYLDRCRAKVRTTIAKANRNKS